MRLKLMVSHLANNRTRVKMAKVNGCTFFRRGDQWVHVKMGDLDSCSRANAMGWRHQVWEDQGGTKVRVPSKGFKLFVAEANKELKGQLAKLPPNPRKHIMVEVT